MGKLLTANEVCAQLRMSRRTLSRWIRERGFPVKRPKADKGRPVKLLFEDGEVRAYMRGSGSKL